jgi:hypothetical protein
MDLKRLYEILNDTTMQLRKGDVVHGDKPLVDALKTAKTPEDFEKLPGGVVTIDAMPHHKDAAGVEKIDLQFLVIGVDKAKAERHRAELVSILKTYPNPERLAGGPSYIEVGAELGDQGAAFQLFALGQALRLWDVITPATMGFDGEEAAEMAGQGFIMISGFRGDVQAA